MLPQRVRLLATVVKTPSANKSFSKPPPLQFLFDTSRFWASSRCGANMKKVSNWFLKNIKNEKQSRGLSFSITAWRCSEVSSLWFLRPTTALPITSQLTEFLPLQRVTTFRPLPRNNNNNWLFYCIFDCFIVLLIVLLHCWLFYCIFCWKCSSLLIRLVVSHRKLSQHSGPSTSSPRYSPVPSCPSRLPCADPALPPVHSGNSYQSPHSPPSHFSATPCTVSAANTSRLPIAAS